MFVFDAGGNIIHFMNDRFESDELIYKGRVAEVHKIGLRMHDGRVVPRDFIKYQGAAVILPILPDGSMVFIKNYRFTVDEHLYELPAGMLEIGEPLELCAARELIEETGYTAGKIEELGVFYTGPGTTNEHMHSFLATDLKNGRQALEVYEEITVEILSESDVRKMILDGTIHDGKTIATLALYWLRKGE